MALPPRKDRAQIARKVTYKPPSVLDMPPASDEVEYRWIRTAILNVDDAKNLSSRRREGWVPVKREEHPDFDGPPIEEGKYAGCFGIGDLILMKNSKENVEARRDYYSGKTELQQDAVENDMLKENNPAMPILAPERASKATIGSRKTQFDE